MLPQSSTDSRGNFQQGGGSLLHSGPQLPPHLAMNEKQLTAAIKNATTAERLAQLAEAHSAKLNPIHVAAILTKMANISKKAPTQTITQLQRQAATGDKPGALYAMKSLQTRQALAEQLLEKLKAQKCQGHCPRGLANIVWAIAKLQCNPDLDLVKMLLQNFCNQLPVAVPQDIANILWGVAQLTRDYGGAASSAAVATNSSTNASKDSAVMQGNAATAAAVGTYKPGILDSAASAAAELAAGMEPGSNNEPAVHAASGPVTTLSSITLQPPAASSNSMRSGDSWVAAAPAAGEQHNDSTPNTAGAPSSSNNDNSCAKALSKHPPLLTVVQVQLLLRQLCSMLPLAASQTISNITWAIAVLQYNHGWCMCGCLPQMRQLAVAFASKLGDALPGHVQRVVRCLTQVSAACSKHAGLAWVEWQPPVLQAMMQHLVAQRKQLKQCHVATVLKDVAQVAYLHLPADVAAQLDRDAGAAAAKAVASVEAAEQAQQNVQRQQTDGVSRILVQAGAFTRTVEAPPAAAVPAEVRSPVSQVTHELVSAMFDKLLSQDTGGSSGAAGAATPPAATVHPASVAAAMAELVQGEIYSDDEDIGSEDEGGPGGVRSTSSSVLPVLLGPRLSAAARAAARSAAAAAIMKVVIPQLDSLGILHPYNALRGLYTHHNTAVAWLFKPETGNTTKQEGIPDYKDMFSGPQPTVVPYHLQLKQQQQLMSQQQGPPQVAVQYGGPPPPPQLYPGVPGYMQHGFYPPGMVPAAVPYGYYSAAAMYGAHSGPAQRGSHTAGQFAYGAPSGRQPPGMQAASQHPAIVPPPPPPLASGGYIGGGTYAAGQQQHERQQAAAREDHGSSSRRSSGSGAASGRPGDVQAAAAASAAAGACDASQSDVSHSYEHSSLQCSPFESAISSAADAIGPAGTVSSGPSNITASGSSGARSSMVSTTSSMNSMLSMHGHSMAGSVKSAGTNASGMKCPSSESMPHAYNATRQSDCPLDLHIYSGEQQQPSPGVLQHHSFDAVRSSQGRQQQQIVSAASGTGEMCTGHRGSSSAAAVISGQTSVGTIGSAMGGSAMGGSTVGGSAMGGSTVGGSAMGGSTPGGTTGDFMEGSSHTGSAMFMYVPPRMAVAAAGSTACTTGTSSRSMQQYMTGGNGPGSTGVAAAAAGALPSDPGPSAKLLMQQQQPQQPYQVRGAQDDAESGKVVYLQVNGQSRAYNEMPDGSLVPLQQQQPQPQQPAALHQRHSVTGAPQQHSASLLHQQHVQPQQQQQQHMLLMAQSSAPAAYSLPLQQHHSYQQQWQLGSMGSESCGLMQQQQLPTASQYITSALSGSVAAASTGMQTTTSGNTGPSAAGAAVYQEPVTGTTYTIQQQQLLDATGGSSSYAAFAAPVSGGPGAAVAFAGAGGAGSTQMLLPSVAVGMQGNMAPIAATGLPMTAQHRDTSGVDAPGLIGGSVGASGQAAGSGYVYLAAGGTMQQAFGTLTGQPQQQLQGTYTIASEQFGGIVQQQQYVVPGVQGVSGMTMQQAAMHSPGVSMGGISNMGMATAAASQTYMGGASGPSSQSGTLHTLLLDPNAMQQQQQQQQLLDFQQQQLLLQPALMAPQQQQQQAQAVYYITPPGF